MVVGCGRLCSSMPSSALMVALLLRFAGPFFSDMATLSSVEDSGVSWRVSGRMRPNGYSEPVSSRNC